MCGFVFVDDAQVDLDLVHTALQRIVHRGPDGQKIIRVSESVIMGHARLSVLGGEDADQPVLFNNGALVYNGEIYNHKYLDSRLGIESNLSDTKTLAQMCATRNICDGLQDIDGMFAFVFYNKNTQEWFAARDRFGIKPLYYCTTQGNGIAFSSEAKGLKDFANGWSINYEALAFFLSYQYYPPGTTLFNEVHEVRPGEMLTGSGAKIKKSITYHHIQVNDSDYEVDRSEVVEKYRSLLSASVDSHLLADDSNKITSYLSGGIDSGLISVLAAKKKSTSHQSFHGYFSESHLYDESEYAYSIAEGSDIDLVSVLITQDMINDSFLSSLACLDSPLAGPGLIPQYIMSNQVSKTTKVVLGGQGGDEVFGGYARYSIALLAHSLITAVQAKKSPWDSVISETSSLMLGGLKQYMPMLQKLLQNASLYKQPSSAYELILNRSSDLPKELLYSLADQVSLAKNNFIYSFDQVQSESFLDKMLITDIYGQLQALLQVDDRTTMASSVESRVPLLANSIVKEWFSEPTSIRMWGIGSKAVPKHIAKQLLPNKVNNRTDKMGFPVPFDFWLANPVFFNHVKELFYESTLLKELAPSYRNHLINSQPGDITYNRSLWGLITLAGWERYAFS